MKFPCYANFMDTGLVLSCFLARQIPLPENFLLVGLALLGLGLVLKHWVVR